MYSLQSLNVLIVGLSSLCSGRFDEEPWVLVPWFEEMDGSLPVVPLINELFFLPQMALMVKCLSRFCCEKPQNPISQWTHGKWELLHEGESTRWSFHLSLEKYVFPQPRHFLKDFFGRFDIAPALFLLGILLVISGVSEEFDFVCGT